MKAAALLLFMFFALAVTAEPLMGAIPAKLTADELVSQMRTGWNLGNTFDAFAPPGSRLTGEIEDIETIWLGGSHNQTTQTLIRELRALGFDVLRIPVTWAKVADPENDWQIREDWMERVQQVVDWALEEDMFVILNTHHENTVIALEIENAHQSDHPGHHFVTNVWRQIAEHFRDYDERLIFASLNEPRHEGGEYEWWGGTQTVRDNVNYLNQVFVDVVRATGGNNVHRILQVPTVAAGASPNAKRDFIVPDDPLNPGVNKILWSIHTYSPFRWAHDGIGIYESPDVIIEDLDGVFENAQRLGIPVLLGEWGSIHVAMGWNADQELRDTQRPQHAEDYIREARARGMVGVVWDNGGFTGRDHTFGIVPRSYPHHVADYHQEIINGIMRGAGASQYIREIGEDPAEDLDEDPAPAEEPEAADYTPEAAPAAPADDDDGFDALPWVVLAVVSGVIVLFIFRKTGRA